VVLLVLVLLVMWSLMLILVRLWVLLVMIWAVIVLELGVLVDIMRMLIVIYDDVEKDDKESEDDYIPSDKKGYEFFLVKLKMVD